MGVWLYCAMLVKQNLSLCSVFLWFMFKSKVLMETKEIEMFGRVTKSTRVTYPGLPSGQDGNVTRNDLV